MGPAPRAAANLARRSDGNAAIPGRHGIARNTATGSRGAPSAGWAVDTRGEDGTPDPPLSDAKSPVKQGADGPQSSISA